MGSRGRPTTYPCRPRANESRRGALDDAVGVEATIADGAGRTLGRRVLVTGHLAPGAYQELHVVSDLPDATLRVRIAADVAPANP